MAMLALRPTVVDFIDTVTYGRGRELEMENVAVGSDSPLVGQTVETIRDQTKAAILAISKKGGKPSANPPGDRVIEVGDRLIIIGTKEQLKALECLCEGEQTK
jgi:voltage-gated potassium channel